MGHLEVEAKSLASPTIPAFFLLKEEERRLRDSLSHRQKTGFKELFVKPTFIINTNSRLINAIHAVGQKDPDLAEAMAREVYDLARLSQREMEPEGLTDFIARSTTMLEALALKINSQS